MSPRIDLKSERESLRGRLQPGPPPSSTARVRTTEDRVLLWAAVASLILHAILLIGVYNRNLGRVDLSGDIGERLYRVERSEWDTILEEEPELPASEGGAGEGAAGDSAASLSEALLSETPTVVSDPRAAEEDVALRRMTDVRPESPTNPLSAPQPQIDLPVTVADQLALGPTLEVPFSEGTSDAADASATAAAAAQALLGEGAGGGGRSGRATPDAGAAERPRVSDARVDLPITPAPVAPAPLPIQPAAITPPEATAQGPTERLDEDFDFVVTHYDPPPGSAEAQGDPRGYFRVDIIPRRTLRKLQTMPKDVVFAIDTSESISVDWLKQALWGIDDSLNTLNPGDRFNIVLFSEQPRFFSAEGPQPATEERIAAARAFLYDAKSGGVTDVNQALSRLVVRDVAVERVYDIVLISDGVPTQGIMDTRELINLITRDNDLAASIYAVGIGREQNPEMLQYLAYRNKGYTVFVDRPERASAAIRDLMSRLRYPIMKDIRMLPAGIDPREVYPQVLPNLHQGETLSIYGRAARNTGEFTMDLLGHNGQRALGFTFTRSMDEAQRGDRQLARTWAFWKLHHLYTQTLRQGETPELRRAIEDLRRRYGLRTVY